MFSFGNGRSDVFAQFFVGIIGDVRMVKEEIMYHEMLMKRSTVGVPRPPIWARPKSTVRCVPCALRNHVSIVDKAG